MKSICIIPARGGSKRLPRKNILPFKGSPLLAHVIDTAIQSKLFDDVIVSSEDSEILHVARRAGAEIHLRDVNIAGDRSTVVEVCLDVLSRRSVENFCCLYATAVLVSSETLRQSAQAFRCYGAANASVLMGVSRYNYHPVQALVVEGDGAATMMFPEYKGVQSQFYPEVRVSNGTFYWGRLSSFLQEKTFYSNKLKLFDVPAREVCDIDTREDYDRLISSSG